MTITHTIPISFFDDEEHEHKRAFICRRNNRTPITKVKFNSLPTSDRSSFSEKIFLNSDSSNNININNNNIVKEIVIKDTQKEEKNENISLDQLLDNLQSNYENSLQSNKNELNNNDNKENEVNKVDIKTSNDINNDNNDKNNDNNNDNNNGEGENRTTPASKLVFFKRDSKIDHVIVDDDKNVNDNSSNNNSNNSNNNSSNSNTSSDSIGRDLESSVKNEGENVNQINAKNRDISPVLLRDWKAGFMWKRKVRKGNNTTAWVQHYFQCRSNGTFTFSSNQNEKQQGEINITFSRIKKLTESDLKDFKENKLFTFGLNTTNFLYHFAATSEIDQNEWISSLDRAIKSSNLNEFRNSSNNNNNNNNSNNSNNMNNSGNNSLNSHGGSPNIEEKKRHSVAMKKINFFTVRSKKNEFEIVRENNNSNNNTPLHNSSEDQNNNNNNNNIVISGGGSNGCVNSSNNHNNISSRKRSVIQEIITTERDYVYDLLVVLNNYITKLEAYRLLRGDQKDAIFGNFIDLIPLHQNLLSELEMEYEKENPNFSPGPQFEVYARYCFTQSSSKEAIQKYCSENYNIYLCLEELKIQPEVKKLDLESYLIKPLQRLCKYPLLLRELKNATEEDDPNYLSVDNALEVISKVVNQVNETKRKADNLIQLLQIQESIVDKDIFLQSKERYLVKEMEFKKVIIDNITARSYTWLFNDLLLIARRKEKNRYLFRSMISLDLSCSINDLDPNGTVFSVVGKDKNDKITATFHASSVKEKLEWIELLSGVSAKNS